MAVRVGQADRRHAGTNVLTNHGVTAKTTDQKEGGSSADIEKAEKDYLWIADANLSADFPLSSATASKSISVAFWMKLESLPANDNTYNAFSKYNATTNQRTFSTVVDYQGFVGFLIGTTDGKAYEETWTKEKVVVGKWYHVVYTFQNSDKSYRINVWDGETSTLLVDTAGKTKTNIVDQGCGRVHRCTRRSAIGALVRRSAG